MKRIIMIVAMVAAASVSHATSSVEVVRTPGWKSAGMTAGLDVVVNKDGGGLCQVKSATSPYAWVDISAPADIVEMECARAVSDSLGVIHTMGRWRTATGNWRAFIGSESESFELPPFGFFSRDFSMAYDMIEGVVPGRMAAVGTAYYSPNEKRGFFWSSDQPDKLTLISCSQYMSCNDYEVRALAPELLPELGLRYAGAHTYLSGHIPPQTRRRASYGQSTLPRLVGAIAAANDEEAVDINDAATVMVGHSGFRIDPLDPVQHNFEWISPAVFLPDAGIGGFALPSPSPAWCVTTVFEENQATAVTNTDGHVWYGGSYCGKAFIALLHDELSPSAWSSEPIDVLGFLGDEGVDVSGITSIETVETVDTSTFDTDGMVRITGTATNTSAEIFAYKAVLDMSESCPIDDDEDGICDVRDDNCLGVANPGQEDQDEDGYGTACDNDVDNNGVVGSSDVFVVHGASSASAPWTPPEIEAFDVDQDGTVGSLDVYQVFLASGESPGPSARECAKCDGSPGLSGCP